MLQDEPNLELQNLSLKKKSLTSNELPEESS